MRVVYSCIVAVGDPAGLQGCLPPTVAPMAAGLLAACAGSTQTSSSDAWQSAADVSHQKAITECSASLWLKAAAYLSEILF